MSVFSVLLSSSVLPQCMRFTCSSEVSVLSVPGGSGL